MEAHRSTDNIQQKASDCLGTVNEWTFEPVFLGPRPTQDVMEYLKRVSEDGNFLVNLYNCFK